ncbi:MAG: hypothetical protein GOVbin1709_81 [Prokaryotic dsDNA virus sp.]|nr:MAG: hypothetical protein GOVbin1709_81 [Prokaryotic dsDNA virus sp.]|tara:strand:+ start:8396 stop:8794 length:399 start_codon:yes stop_codon:yes gene_type:complete
MATTAKLTLVSSDLLSDALDLEVTQTLYKAGASTDIALATGLARYSAGTTSETKILEADDYTDNKAAKLYIKNTSTTRSDYIYLTLGTAGSSSTIGRLYGGEWALIPWSGASDINLNQSGASIVIEWMLFYE